MLPHILQSNFGKIEGIKVEGLNASAIFSGLGTLIISFASKPHQLSSWKKIWFLGTIKNAIGSFFDSKPTEFYSSGIYKLVIRWEKFIQKDGQYIKD